MVRLIMRNWSIIVKLHKTLVCRETFALQKIGVSILRQVTTLTQANSHI